MTGSRLVVAEIVRTPFGVAGNAMLVNDGTVVAIGNRDDLAKPTLAEERYPGAVIVPGLRDAHFHPIPYAAALTGTSLKTAADLREVSARLTKAARGRSPGRPLIAIRLDDEALRERRLPTRHDLDQAVADRPVLVHRYCGHIAVANTAGLSAAGVTAATVDPVGGVIDRDPTGSPTGVLRETAVDLVAKELSRSKRIDAAEITAAMTGLAGLGITSIGAMTGLGDHPWGSSGSEAEALVQAATELPIRVHSYVIAADPPALLRAAEEIRHAGTNLRWAGVKRFGDGSLGGHTAAMHEPFADAPDERGTLRLTALDEELARTSLNAGGSVAIHAIGDLACGAVIDLFEQLVAEGIEAKRLRLEHASVLTRDDVARLGRIGIIASVQPAFMASETTWLEKRLGPDRLHRTYPLASLEAAGVPLAGGSDCPVEPPDPWAGIALARDRAGIFPSEGLSAESAFRLFTSGAAFALGEPEPLAVGSPADFVVVDRDPVTSTPDEIRATQVIDTWVGGETVPVDRSVPVWTD